MDKQRQKHIEKMQELRAAIEKTDSKYLRRDFGKALRRMDRELRQYDGFRHAE